MDCFEDSTAIFCSSHPNLKVNYIKFSQENSELKCQECMFEEGQLGDYISIQSIKMCNDDYIFKNWPPLTDYSLLQDIKAITKPDANSIEQLELQIDKIIRNIITNLEQEKKKMIQKIISLREKKQEILTLYNEISGRDQFKQLINFNQQIIKQNIIDIKQFISEKFQQKVQNTTILKQQLQKYKNQNICRFDDTETIRNSIEDEIDVFIIKLQQLIQSEIYLQTSQQAQLNLLLGNSIFCKKGGDQFPIIKRDDLYQNKISIIKSLDTDDLMYFKYNLTKNKYYTIRFKFNNQAGNCFIIGVINQKDLSCLQKNHLGKVFCENNTTYCGRVTKGSYFDSVQKDKILEMRLDIENSQLQFLDYPNYLSVNELNEEYYLKQDADYFLAIQFINNEKYQTIIDLIYFEEIQK
ncbi:cytochrome P450 family protein, putative (macronuclear) [Tetrahymena thermophila SB210]|uniref:Cytochrome P450 family protein, putative n=1 Tax=Tetrahymena thermophila (strain SB210) TaxID=312017 RepID=I7M1X1_TETTS|nr:cytochrome P450 family protein, putative [Tetrahymena thermophila SB210]EAR97950.1 cytochrome P450 family protein, putative [Tetrahymena thermophila SB210]|eukprot:XP_001018195.1 cytochrome P450 family protein, putative [Tetrahymena thermophila SB210]